MSGTLGDAMKKAGVVTPETPETKPEDDGKTSRQARKDKKKWNEELSDDETLPPRFDAPAVTKVKETPKVPSKPKQK
jgi:hypothetical protein